MKSIFIILLIFLVAGCSNIQTQTDKDKLSSEIESRVMEKLKSSAWLQQEIEKGILEYDRKRIKDQRLTRAQQEQQKAEKAKSVKAPDRLIDHVKGNPDAEVSLIEYSDFRCPYCKKFHPTLQQVVEKYQGKVNWVYRHFPLSMHNPHATKMAEASECANELGGNDYFWKFTDALYLQPKGNNKSVSTEQLVAVGKKLGLDVKPFKLCINNARHAQRVLADIEEGQRIGVTGTPATIIRNNVTGNVLVKSGAVPLDTVVEAIDQLLAKERDKQ